MFASGLLAGRGMTRVLKAGHACLSRVVGRRAGRAFARFMGNFHAGRTIHLLSSPSGRAPLGTVSTRLNFGSVAAFCDRFRTTANVAPTRCEGGIRRLRGGEWSVGLLSWVCPGTTVTMFKWPVFTVVWGFVRWFTVSTVWTTGLFWRWGKAWGIVVGDVGVGSVGDVGRSSCRKGLLQLTVFFITLFLYKAVTCTRASQVVDNVIMSRGKSPLPTTRVHRIDRAGKRRLTTIVASVGKRFQLALLHATGRVRVSCLNCRSGGMELADTGDCEVILRPTSRLLSRIIMAKCRAVSERQTANSFTGMSSGGLRARQLDDIDSLVRKEVTNCDSNGVHNIASVGKLAAPLCIVSKFPMRGAVSSKLNG